MTEQQAKKLIATLTLEEKIQLNEMLKAMEKRRFQLHPMNEKGGLNHDRQ